MIEKDQKEILTKYRCRCDVNHKGISQCFLYFVMALVSMPLIWWIWVDNTLGVLIKWFYLVTFCFFAVVFLISAIELFCMYISFQRFRFCIIKDKVVSTRTSRTRRYYMHYHIEFGSCEEFTIPKENYTWSELSRASNADIYEMTGAGDEFYVVVKMKRNRKGKTVPLAIYNKKIFEVSEKSFEKRDGVWYVKGE